MAVQPVYLDGLEEILCGKGEDVKNATNVTCLSLKDGIQVMLVTRCSNSAAKVSLDTVFSCESENLQKNKVKESRHERRDKHSPYP